MAKRHIALVLTILGLGLLGCQLPDPDDYQPKKTAEKPPPILPPPLVIGFVLVDVEPSFGSLRGMDLVALSGGGFQEGARVFFGGSEGLNAVVSNSEQIWVSTPPHPAGTVTVRVVNPDGGETAQAAAFEYRAERHIETVKPFQGPSAGGIPIEIHGVGLRGVDAVLVGGRMALDVTAIDDSTVLAVLPEGVSGMADVHVIGPGGVGRAENAFLYHDLLRVMGLAPQIGPVTGGGVLSLTGDGLVGESLVFFGDVLAENVLTSTDGHQLGVRVPPGTEGPADITIVTPLETLVLPDAFVYLEPAVMNDWQIYGVWPPTGPASGNIEVVLTVTDLPDDVGEIGVQFGSKQANPTHVYAAQDRLHVLTPPGTPGNTVTVSVMVPGRDTITLDAAYTYERDVAIVSVEPGTGPTDGGTQLHIAGDGFEGDTEVWVGALPAVDVIVHSPTLLSVTTAPGSPGPASVRVRSGGHTVTMEQGFEYGGLPPELFVSSPQSAAIAGNTLVHFYGVNLPGSGTLHFGDLSAEVTDRLSSTHIVVRTPRAEDIGSVSVHLEDDGRLMQLPHPFTFYDPRSQWGGTWGGPVDDSLNVTVRESASGDPVESALVVIGHAVPPLLMGYTDDRGQVTLSMLGLRGALDITAAREGFGASSVMDFDATNVTLSLESMQPPSTGPGGGKSFPPGAVTGMVQGIGKYLVLPLGTCEELEVQTPEFCTPCETDSDCSGMAPNCSQFSNQEAFCSSDCAVDTDCPEQFQCGTTSEGTPRCVPSRGERQVRCFVSNSSFLSSPKLDADAIVHVDAGEQAYSIANVRLGEVAVYCIGGLAKNTANGAVFEPYAMGIDRHVFIPPGPDPDSGESIVPVRVDITLNIPLNETVRMTVEPRPHDPDQGPNVAEASVLLELGSDGFIPLVTRVLERGERDIVLDGLPNALTGELYDATYLYYASALTDMDDFYPTSEVLRGSLNAPNDGPFFRYRSDGWTEETSGYDGDVTSVLTMPSGTAMAATSAGGVMTYDGSNWWPQPVANDAVLRGVATDGQSGAIFVGDAGRTLHFDGVAWSDVVAPTERNLHAVVNTGDLHAVAVGEYVAMQWSDGTWAPIEWGPPKDLRGICRGKDMGLWAVGRHGAVLQRVGAEDHWESVNVPTHEHLNRVWCDHNGVVIAVGEGGHALHGHQATGVFQRVNLPTDATLRDVWGRHPSEVYAVGDGATILKYNGVEWSTVTEGSQDVSLRAVHGLPEAGELLLAMGSYAIHMGPFVWIPAFSQPQFGQAWSPYGLDWSIASGAEPSLHEMRIYSATGSLAWSITSPGHLRTMQLPDLWAIGQMMIPPPGGKRMYSYLVDHPDFDINEFDLRAFHLRDWNAWAISTLTFDNL